MDQELEQWDCDQSFEPTAELSSAFNMEEWEMRGKELAKKDTDVKWELGDWLNEGDGSVPSFPVGLGPDAGLSDIDRARWSDVYDWAMEITGLARSTLMDLASTARRMPHSVRTEALSWSHHRVLINALPDSDEDTLKQWLQRAVDENLSVSKLGQAIRSRARVLSDPTVEKSFVVTVPINVWETLQDFADHERSAVQGIAAQWLVENSKLEETQTQRKLAKQETKRRRRERRRQVGLRVARVYDPLGLRR